MMLKTVIVDDETLARERLKMLLAAEPDIEIAAECSNGEEAVQCLRTQEFDLLFLDIQMPAMTGLGVVQELGAVHLPPTIFITAYQEHAVEAFEVQAVDYLTKPISPQRLQQAVVRVRERLAAQRALLTEAQFTAMLAGLRSSRREEAYLTRLLVREGTKDVLLQAEAIEWIEAADYYSSLHVKGHTYLLRKSMAELNQELDPAVFLRVHRSVIVNLNHVSEIYREGRDEGTVVLLGGQRLRISKLGRQELLSYASPERIKPSGKG